MITVQIHWLYHSHVHMVWHGDAGERCFKMETEEVVLMGGNYVIKGPPYFPPKEVVRANALEMSQGDRKKKIKNLNCLSFSLNTLIYLSSYI